VIEPRRAPHLPQIHPAAWHGPIGEAVVRIAPVTEADPVAVLASCLALFGAMAGDNAYVRVGGVQHPARIWPLVVGKTGAGRKGTSMAEARNLARGWGGYAEAYTRHRVTGGLASGEGLITALGGAVGTRGGAKGEEPQQQEAAAPDGKLTAVESEFARVLSAAKRDGSTLGPIMRQLWDDGAASILTKAAPMSVQGAHLTVIAHVTPRELRLRLAESDLAGGTLNRFLLVGSERPHLLAHERPHPDVEDQGRWLAKALDAVRVGGGELRRDRAADGLWEAVYAALCADEPDGQLGSVLARGPAYTMRLALAYALADGCGAIQPRHLLAGLALWQYSAATARLVFPEGSARVVMERLAGFLATAGDAGRTRTEITQHFARNKSAGELGALLDEFERHGQVTIAKEGRDGAGRPALRYRWVGRNLDPMAELLARYYELNERTNN